VRGDLLFWSKNGAQSGISHVAIYLGNNQIVAAVMPGVGVVQEPLWTSGDGLTIMPFAKRLG
jgi:cell wall-associated NlpC family hydrolase